MNSKAQKTGNHSIISIKNCLKNRKSIIIGLLICFLSSGVFAQSNSKLVEFTDLQNDENMKPVLEFASRGIFTGIDGKAALDQNILKTHSAIFLQKVLGEKSPTLTGALERGLLSKIPEDETKLLSKAEWIVMCARAFKVPLEKIDTKQWYEPAWEMAQKITIVKKIDKPFDNADRGFVIRTAYFFEKVFGIQSAEDKIVKIEKNLMIVRDAFLENKKTNFELEELLWNNLIEIESLPPSNRVTALRDFYSASLVLLEIRKDTDENRKNTRKNWAYFFINAGIKKLPGASGFANDLKTWMEK